jgi:hypothetical protein
LRKAFPQNLPQKKTVNEQGLLRSAKGFEGFEDMPSGIEGFVDVS